MFAEVIIAPFAFIAGFTFKKCKIVKKRYVLGELSHCINEIFRLISNGMFLSHCFFIFAMIKKTSLYPILAHLLKQIINDHRKTTER